MASRFVLLLLLASGAVSLDQTREQYTSDHKADLDIHECRACKMVTLDALASCPKMGFECDESLPIARPVLYAGDCDCAQLKCRDAKATLVVEGVPVGKIRCKNRKWTTPLNSEAVSAACARKCGRVVCAVLPPSHFENQDVYLPLVVNRPDASHPCAWAECQHGAMASGDVIFDGFSTFSCSGDGTWTYTGPEAERRQLTDVACAKESACKLCSHINQGARPGGIWDSPSIDTTGTCAKVSYTCTGGHLEYFKDGTYEAPGEYKGAVNQNPAVLRLTCNADTKWEDASGQVVGLAVCFGGGGG